MKTLSVSLLLLSILCFIVLFFIKISFLSLLRPDWLIAGIIIYLVFVLSEFVRRDGRKKGVPEKSNRQPVGLPEILLSVSILSALAAALVPRILIRDTYWISIAIIFYLLFELRMFIDAAGKTTNIPVNKSSL